MAGDRLYMRRFSCSCAVDADADNFMTEIEDWLHDSAAQVVKIDFAMCAVDGLTYETVLIWYEAPPLPSQPPDEPLVFT